MRLRTPEQEPMELAVQRDPSGQPVIPGAASLRRAIRNVMRDERNLEVNDAIGCLRGDPTFDHLDERVKQTPRQQSRPQRIERALYLKDQPLIRSVLLEHQKQQDLWRSWM